MCSDVVTLEFLTPHLRLLLELTLTSRLAFAFVVASLAARGLPTFHAHDLILRITWRSLSRFQLRKRQNLDKAEHAFSLANTLTQWLVVTARLKNLARSYDRAKQTYLSIHRDNGRGETRTRTPKYRILSAARLPIPPLALSCRFSIAQWVLLIN